MSEFVLAIGVYTATVSCSTVRMLFEQWFDVFNGSASRSMSSSDMVRVMHMLSAMKVLGKQEVRDVLGAIFTSFGDMHEVDDVHGTSSTSTAAVRASSTGSNADDGDTLTKTQFVEVLDGLWGRIKCVEGFTVAGPMKRSAPISPVHVAFARGVPSIAPPPRPPPPTTLRTTRIAGSTDQAADNTDA